MLSMLRTFPSELLEDWNDHLPCVICADHLTTQESTRCSASLMVFMRENNLPIDLIARPYEELGSDQLNMWSGL